MEHAGIAVKFPGFAGAMTPQDCYVFFDDFLGTSFADDGTAEQSVWLKSEVSTQAVGQVTILDGTDDAEDEAGGVLKIATGASVDEGDNLQVNGESFHFADGYPLYFETRINCGDVSNVDYLVGLARTDTEILTGGHASDMVCFRHISGTLSFVSEHTTDEKTIDTGITEDNDDWIRLAFYWDGDDNLDAWVDTNDDGVFDKHVGTLKASTTAHYINQAVMMTPTIEAITGTTATAETFYVDYVLCAQQRFRE